MNNSTENDTGLRALAAELFEHTPALFSAFEDYSRITQETGESCLTPRLSALVRLAVALVIPNRDLARAALEDARRRASKVDIAGCVNAACNLRAGAAIAYGRLVFKLREVRGASGAEAANRSQLANDRDFMTTLRRSSPEPFDAFS